MSLSDDRVISLLNRYFVPVYVANEDYREGGCALPEEKAELRRIHQEGHAAKLSVGSVHAYVLDPGGRLRDSMHVANAAKADALAAMLERQVRELSLQAGQPVVKPVPPPAPEAAPGTLRLHIVARYLERRGSEYVLVENAGGNWSAFPGEDWVTLEPEAWRKLLPAGRPAAGQAWEPDPAVAARILGRFYPPTENNDLSKNRIERQSLRGTVLSVQGGVVRASLEGGFRMKHPFYHKDDDRFVEGTLAGYLEWEPGQRIRAFRLVTDEATYRGSGSSLPFGVAARSL